MCLFCVGCGKCSGEKKELVAPGTCPLCGAPNEPDAAKCTQCGSPLFSVAAGRPDSNEQGATS